MSDIHILDDITVDKIAAGEVVERPASVVKELVENSIDANSTKIEVEIMAGGTSFIRITDNGEGMDNKNARLSILRHATSKIKKVDDLSRIDSLGFRGEALPSIAAVSRFQLLTRKKTEDLGTSIKVHGGKVNEVEDAGCNIGTTIKVEDLFYNIPARKKFLKTTTTEGNKINDFLIKLALSKPHISFKLINNNRLCLSTPGNNSSFDVIDAIYGNKVSNELLPIEYSSDEIHIQGFISKPAVIRSSRNWQTILVNGRIIASKVIYKAIDNAYHSLIPKSGYPFILLDIKVDKCSIDINVHPQKADVKFENESKIFKAVYTAISSAIKPTNKDLTLGDYAAPIADSFVENNKSSIKSKSRFEKANFELPFSNNKLEYRDSINIQKEPIYSKETLIDFHKAKGDLLLSEEKTISLDRNLQNDILALDMDLTDYVPKPAKGVTPEEIREQEALIKSAGEMYPIGQIDKCFIIAQGYYGGMYIIDQHAAHERILYDKFGKQKERVGIQNLLIHLFINVNHEELDILENNKDILLHLGFDMELASQNQIRIIGIPADLNIEDGEDTFRLLLKRLMEMHNPTAREIRHSCVAMRACKAAIKAGDELTLTQMEVLLQELGNTTLPYTCPHGRPTIIKFSTYDLEKMFKRIK